MPSQDESKRKQNGNSDDTVQTTVQESLFDAIKAKDLSKVVQIISDNPGLDLNCLDKDELTPLQHVAHTGDVEMARFLLNNGAKVDFTNRQDEYTPLMFAAISAKSEVVRLLLERGTDTTLKNCVNRTAAEMAAFVGQTKTVAIINGWIPYETSVEPYTRRRELEDEPRIPTKKLGHLLHNYITCPSVHPVKLLLHIRDNLDLIKFGAKFLYVLEDLCSKSLKPPTNEESSFRYYYLGHLLETCLKNIQARQKDLNIATPTDDTTYDASLCEQTISLHIKRLVRRGNPKDQTSCTIKLDRFIVDCLMKYPYTNSAIFKTMTFALSKLDSVGLNNSYSILTQILNWPRLYGHVAEACSICGEVDKNKKCSKCKLVYYCGPACQQIDWFQHKKNCSSPEEEPLIK